MRRLAEFLIGALDLAEAQAREVGRAGKRAARGAAMNAAAVALVLFGILMCLAAMAIAIAAALGAAWALFLTGITALVLGVIAILVLRWTRD